MADKTLDVTSNVDLQTKVPDVTVVGADLWRVLCKASSVAQGWMKSTKAMQLPNGCLVQTTTQQKNHDGTYSLADTLTFVAGVQIEADINGGSKLGNMYARDNYPAKRSVAVTKKELKPLPKLPYKRKKREPK